MKTKWIVFSGIAMLFAAWVVAWRTAEARRRELAEWSGKAAEVARLQQVRQRLQAAQMGEADVEQLRVDHEETLRLRREIARIHERVTERVRAAPTAAELEATRIEPSINDDFASFDAWRNVGQRTPADAVQTALWAAAGGDLKTLSATLVLEPAAREKVHRLLDRLPREVSAQFKTAEDFIALLTSNDVPQTEAHLIEPKVNTPDRVAVRVVVFRDADGKTRTAPLSLYQMNPTEWRLLVPEAAVDKYAKLIAGAQRP